MIVLSVNTTALGMELTSDYSERVTLFSVKVFCHFVGYMVPNGCGLLLAGYFANDVLSLYAVQAD